MHRLPKWQMFALRFLQQFLMVFLFIKRIWRMHVFMTIWLKIFIWLLLKGHSLPLWVYVNSNAPYMSWNRHPKLSMRSYVLLYLNSPLLIINMTHLCSFIACLVAGIFSFLMLMIWILLILSWQLQASLYMNNTKVICIIFFWP